MSRFDERLAALRQAVADPSAQGAAATIDRALKGKNGLLISIAAEALEHDPKNRLPAAFECLMSDAVKRDPQCQGKTAIAEALRRIDATEDSVFLRGVRYHQREPVWGGSVDTAANLRGICVMALVEAHHPRAMVEAAHLLADPELAARTAAAQAIGNSGRADVGEPLLRLRVEMGDDEPAVLTECFASLLHLAPEPSLKFVTARLNERDDAVMEAAALALGESRLDAALAPLSEQVERTVSADRRRALLLAIAMLRSEAAWERLTSWIVEAPASLAVGALRALGTFSHDERLGQGVRVAVDLRSDGACDAELLEQFGPP